MLFIVYSQVTEKELKSSLGMPEYSYYFVLKGFLPVLRELGDVVVVDDPETEVDPIYDRCRQESRQAVFITFSPPNKSAVGLRCPTFCVFAWEFDRIPDEMWDNDPKNDWRNVLKDHGRTITLSQYAAAAVHRAMGKDFPTAAIPVPVYDEFKDFRRHHNDSLPASQNTLSMSGNVLDSYNYTITPDAFELISISDFFDMQQWEGDRLLMSFGETDDFNGYLGGFYPSEPWGTWSRIERPWVLLPYRVNGKVHLKIRAQGYGANADKNIFVSLGNEKREIFLRSNLSDIDLSFNLSEPADILTFSGLDLSPVPNAPDPRSMGIALFTIELSRHATAKNQTATDFKTKPLRKISLDGVVFTSVFNPADDRKNWSDIIKAFCLAFREVKDATLVLKMTHHRVTSFMGKLHFLFQQMWPFQCRIVALHGYLDKPEYERLIAATHFYVTASRCEGLCLPLMEYMSCGRPAITVGNTAFADYVDTDSSLIVDSSIEPGFWPHDPLQILRTFRYRIDFESLVEAFRQGYDIAKNQPGVYRKMSQAATLRMKGYSSTIAVKERMRDFIEKTIFN